MQSKEKTDKVFIIVTEPIMRVKTWLVIENERMIFMGTFDLQQNVLTVLMWIEILD